MTESKEAASPQLSKKQIKYLRGIGHKLSPLVLIGKEGLNDKIFQAVETELENHELIKVKIGTNSSVDKTNAAEIIPTSTGSALVQLIGKTLMLYKANPKKPKDKRILLPKI